MSFVPTSTTYNCRVKFQIFQNLTGIPFTFTTSFFLVILVATFQFMLLSHIWFSFRKGNIKRENPKKMCSISLIGRAFIFIANILDML